MTVEKQSHLDGSKDFEDCEEEGLDIVKSALQKSIRRGNAEASMYWALELVNRNWWSCWRRLSIIAVEDVGQPLAIISVGELYREFMMFRSNSRGSGKITEKHELTWDEKRCVVCCAKILAESPKDRRSDEFLEFLDVTEKRGEKNSELLEKVLAFCKIEDYFLDMHTIEGRKLGRGNLYWFETSSETEHKSPEYAKWHDWFKPMMIAVETRRKEERARTECRK